MCQSIQRHYGLCNHVINTAYTCDSMIQPPCQDGEYTSTRESRLALCPMCDPYGRDLEKVHFDWKRRIGLVLRQTASEQRDVSATDRASGAERAVRMSPTRQIVADRQRQDCRDLANDLLASFYAEYQRQLLVMYNVQQRTAEAKQEYETVVQERLAGTDIVTVARQRVIKNILQSVPLEDLGKDDRGCNICGEKLHDTTSEGGSERPVAVPCSGKHVFGDQCIRTWLSDKRTCPMCREEVIPRVLIMRLDDLVLGAAMRLQVSEVAVRDQTMTLQAAFDHLMAGFHEVRDMAALQGLSVEELFRGNETT